jgi:hypothetical protein
VAENCSLGFGQNAEDIWFRYLQKGQIKNARYQLMQTSVRIAK